MAVAGEPVDVESLRPRARTVLRMLAVDVGAGVHRETLYEQLWPTDDQATAAKKLQVAISSIRRVLDGAADLVRRRGDVYVLDTAGEVCDVHRVAAAVASGRAAMARGDADGGRRVVPVGARTAPWRAAAGGGCRRLGRRQAPGAWSPT